MIARLWRRLRKPAHIGWGGDYTGDWTFTTCWSPAGLEIR